MKRYLNEIKDFKPLTVEEEREIMLKAKNGNNGAYNKLMNSNLKFVVSVAKKYQKQGLELEDLIAEGNLGLCKAFKKFDMNRNVKFITYAVWWIRQAILNAIHEHAKTIRLPLNKIINITKSRKAEEKFVQKKGRLPDMFELAHELDDPRILEDLKHSYTLIALDEPHTDDGKDLYNIIPAQDDVLDEAGKRDEFLGELKEALKDFTEREKEIIYMYYGINHVRPYTLKEIGIDMGLTRERIRQIKEKILTKLRKQNRSGTLRSYM
tara:strand:- start:526 stop:1323 length:798 start_codon:yes stop_codon:yes gene_type:complete